MANQFEATQEFLQRLECAEGGEMTEAEAQAIAAELDVTVDDLTCGAVVWVLADGDEGRTFAGFLPAWTDPQVAMDQRSALAIGGVPVAGLTVRPVYRDDLLASIHDGLPTVNPADLLRVDPDGYSWELMVVLDAVMSGGHDADPRLGRMLFVLDRAFNLAVVARREADRLGYNASRLTPEDRNVMAQRVRRLTDFAIMALQTRTDAAVAFRHATPDASDEVAVSS